MSILFFSTKKSGIFYGKSFRAASIEQKPNFLNYMKQSFQLNIENPCHEQWESFTPTSTGGFCASCQKNVIDFSRMSESELVAFFRDHQNSSQGLCGRFREDQLKRKYNIEEWFPTWRVENNQLQYEIPVTVIKQKQQIHLPLIQRMKLVRNMAAAVLTLLSIEQGIGQTRMISGQIIDAESKEALPGTSIFIKGTTKGTVSDYNGNYKIEASESDTLIFGFVGFKLIEKKVKNDKDFAKIALEADYMGLLEVTVVGYSAERRYCISGGVGILGAEIQDQKKYNTKITIWGNAVQNGELILVPDLVASTDSTGNSFERNNEERWFRENGFQQITSVQLYDYSGRIFQESFTKLNDGMISVDVRDIPKGAYLVRAVYKNERSLTENEISTARVLIER